MKAVIVDDEQDARDTLMGLLDAYCPEVEVIALAETAADGVVQIKKHQPDLVFLDVEMPGGTGFDLIEAFDQLNFEVIFTTAHSNYVLKALKISAIDYLLKPIDTKELRAAVDKAQQSIDKDKINRKLETFIANLKVTESQEQKIVIPSAQGFRVAPIKEIIRCQSDRNYTYVHFVDGTYELASKTLKEFDEMLSGNNFFRTHQSHLINLNFVKNYMKGKQSAVLLTDGSEIEIARSKKEEFLARFTS
jgi:two-component system LytT family response regulator